MNGRYRPQSTRPPKRSGIRVVVERIIFLKIELDDMVLAVRAAKWLLANTNKDAIIKYGEGSNSKHFYVRRNKASITVRPC
jgi:hypothetical protein